MLCSLGWAEEKQFVAAPTTLPGVIPQMRSAGFWIARHPAPDEPVLAMPGVMALNKRIEHAGLIEDLSAMPKVVLGVKVRKELSAIIDSLKKRVFYGADDKEVPSSWVAGFEREVDAVPDKVNVLFGFIVRTTDLRLLPAAAPLYNELGDTNFDEIQNSTLVAGTPVAVLAHSRDRKWLFVHDAISSGWVATDTVARAAYDVFVRRVKNERTVIVTSARADIFLDKEMTEYETSVRMGTNFVFKAVEPSCWEVELPAMQEDGTVKFVSGFIPKKDGASHPLPFTPRVIYEQAFKLLDAPYGWGDMNEGQDCSRFLQMIFAAVGVKLPRNSAEQAKVGLLLPGFKEELPVEGKMSLLQNKGLGAVTVLALKGHIMLYLGSYNDKPYAIHSVWAYREPMPDGTQRPRYIGKVAVSSLELGAGSFKGSLRERLTGARVIQ